MYVKINGEWKYLYRAVDSNDNILDFMPNAKREHKAAKKFIKKVLKARQDRQLRVINVDKNATYLIAIEELEQEVLLFYECELR